MYVPLEHSLKLFLGLPGIFNRIIKYVNVLSQNTNLLANVMQGKLWLEKYAEKFKNDIVFPLFMYVRIR